MKRTLFPILKLIRFPNLPTLIADVCAGFFIASRMQPSQLGDSVGSSDTPVWQPLVMLIVAAMLLYAGGMANNDLQHAEKDYVLKKPRPLVAGELSFASAWWISAMGLFGGVLLASLAIGKLGVIAFGIAGCAWLYNWLAKGRRVDQSYIPPLRWQNTLGAVLMSLCRVGSIGLGLAYGALVRAEGVASWQMLADPLIVIAAASALVYFLCVMSASLLEDYGGGTSALRKLRLIVLLPIWAGPIAISTLVFGQASMDSATFTTAAMTALPAAIALIFLTWLIQRRFSMAIADPQPRNVGMIVKWSILGHVFLEAALVMSTSRALLPVGIAIASIFFLCAWLGRFSYST